MLKNIFPAVFIYKDQLEPIVLLQTYKVIAPNNLTLGNEKYRIYHICLRKNEYCIFTFTIFKNKKTELRESSYSYEEFLKRRDRKYLNFKMICINNNNLDEIKEVWENKKVSKKTNNY